jgi:hypothetical protein
MRAIGYWNTSRNYLSFSKFSIERDTIGPFFAEHNLTINKVVAFDPILPEFTHSYLQPSLLYVIATKGA